MRSKSASAAWSLSPQQMAMGAGGWRSGNAQPHTHCFLARQLYWSTLDHHCKSPFRACCRSAFPGNAMAISAAITVSREGHVSLFLQTASQLQTAQPCVCAMWGLNCTYPILFLIDCFACTFGNTQTGAGRPFGAQPQVQRVACYLLLAFSKPFGNQSVALPVSLDTRCIWALKCGNPNFPLPIPSITASGLNAWWSFEQVLWPLLK